MFMIHNSNFILFFSKQAWGGIHNFRFLFNMQSNLQLQQKFKNNLRARVFVIDKTL